MRSPRVLRDVLVRLDVHAWCAFAWREDSGGELESRSIFAETQRSRDCRSRQVKSGSAAGLGPLVLPLTLRVQCIEFFVICGTTKALDKHASMP